MDQAPGTSISNPRRLATLPDILGALSVLQSHESDLSTSLADLLSEYEPISASLSSLQSLSPQLDALAQETRLLDATVSYTARTAQDVGGRVQLLDEEMKRVREASERVGQVMELKVLHRSVFRFTHISYRDVGFASFFTVFNTIPRLGVCFQTLCKSHGCTS